MCRHIKAAIRSSRCRFKESFEGARSSGRSATSRNVHSIHVGLRHITAMQARRICKYTSVYVTYHQETKWNHTLEAGYCSCIVVYAKACRSAHPQSNPYALCGCSSHRVTLNGHNLAFSVHSNLHFLRRSLSRILRLEYLAQLFQTPTCRLYEEEVDDNELDADPDDVTESSQRGALSFVGDEHDLHQI